LYTFADAAERGIVLPNNFNARNQLYRPLAPYVATHSSGAPNYGELEAFNAAAQADMEKYIKWVPIHAIDRTFPLAMVGDAGDMQRELQKAAAASSGANLLRTKYYVVHDEEYDDD
jgi:hypothetical protein